MKQTQAILVMLMASVILLSFSAKEQNTHTLTVEVENLRNSKGVLQVALYNKDGSIPDEHYKKYHRIERVKIINGKSEITFENLPKGRYAVTFYTMKITTARLTKDLFYQKKELDFQTINLSV